VVGGEKEGTKMCRTGRIENAERGKNFVGVERKGVTTGKKDRENNNDRGL